MKKVMLGVLSIILFLSISMPVYAKAKDIRKYDFVSLSDSDRQDTIRSLVETISKDLEIDTTPELCFYSCKEWREAAAYYPGLNYIYINMSTFEDNMDADAAGETFNYHLVKILAHEVRHDYQYEHQEDDSDYGRACKMGFIAHQNFNGDLASYNAQFIEADANEYAAKYADDFCK